MKTLPCLATLLILTLPLATRAADSQATNPANPTLFPQGAFTLQAYGSYTDSHFVFSDDDQLAGLTVGAGYNLWDNINLSLEAAGYYDTQNRRDIPDAETAALQIMLRNHLLTFGKLTLFIDVSGGVSYSTHQVPPGGTNFNYTLRTGPGITYQLADHWHVLTGVHYFHLSNGRLEGNSRNPSINAFEPYLGLIFQF